MPRNSSLNSKAAAPAAATRTSRRSVKPSAIAVLKLAADKASAATAVKKQAAKAQRIAKQQAKDEAAAESEEDYQPIIDDDERLTNLSSGAESDGSIESPTSRKDPALQHVHQARMTEFTDVAPAQRQTKSKAKSTPTPTATSESKNTLVQPVVFSDEDNNTGPAKKQRVGPLRRTISRVVESEDDEADELGATVEHQLPKSPVTAKRTYCAVLKSQGQLLPGAPATTTSHSYLSNVKHAGSSNANSTPAQTLPPTNSAAPSCAVTLPTYDNVSRQTLTPEPCSSETRDTVTPEPSASSAQAPVTPISQGFPTPQRTSRPSAPPQSPTTILETPSPALPSQATRPPLFDSDDTDGEPLAPVVPAKRRRSRKTNAQSAPSDKKGRGIHQFSNEQRLLVVKAVELFKLNILTVNAYPAPGDQLDWALLKAWRSAHVALGYQIADILTLPDPVSTYLRSFMSTMRGQVATEASVKFVGASYGLDKYGKDLAGLEAEKERLRSGKWKPFYYADTHTKQGFCTRPLFVQILQTVIFPTKKTAKSIGALHANVFQNGVPLPAIALVLTAVEHAISHYGFLNVPDFTAAQGNLYDKHLARFSDLDCAKATAPGTLSPSQKLLAKVLALSRPNSSALNEPNAPPVQAMTAEDMEAAAAAADEFND